MPQRRPKRSSGSPLRTLLLVVCLAGALITWLRYTTSADLTGHSQFKSASEAAAHRRQASVSRLIRRGRAHVRADLAASTEENGGPTGADRARADDGNARD